MSVEKIQRDLTNLFNYPSDQNPTTQADYINAVKNWVGNVINLVDIGLWQPETAYEVGAIVRTPSLPVFVLKCITAGTSDVTEPDYTDVREGDTVQDNNIEWVVCTLNTTNASTKANADASNIGVNAETDNSELWGSAIGGGEIAEDDGKLVTGRTVHAVTSVLASDIADNTDDIATNTANISQNATDIDIADKRISNIEKLLQGNLYDYQTDNSSAYTKSVPSGAMPYAGLEKVGGKTVVWNQAEPVISSTDWGQYSSTYTSVSFSDGVATVTVINDSASNKYYYGFGRKTTHSIISGHVYIFSYDIRSNNAGTSFSDEAINTNGGSTIVATNANQWYSFYFIQTANKSTTRCLIKPLDNCTGLIFDVRNVMLIDLTLLCGSGNEPSTVAEFQQMFPASYYPYNAGTLLSAGVTEVDSVGKNNLCMNAYSYLAQGVQGTVQDGTSEVVLKGTNTSSSSSAWFNISMKKPLNAGTYTISAINHSFLSTSYLQFSYNGNLTYAYFHGGSFTFTVPDGATGFKIVCGVAPSATIDKTIQIQVEKGSTATAYSPYQEHSYPIPAAIQALEGYGWSAGTAYNYVDYERKVFVQNVGAVDLGTLTWRYDNATNRERLYTSSIPNIKFVPSITVKANLLCAKYETSTANDTYFHTTDKIIAVTTSNTVYVYDSSYTDASSFKTAMSGVMLYYELATPQEIDISEHLTDDNLIQVEAGGTLTFPNSNGTDYQIPVPSEETYMIDLQSAIGG